MGKKTKIPMKHLGVEIRGKGGGGRSSKPLDKVGQSPKKNFFGPFGLSLV